MSSIVTGTVVEVVVPATSANLGPGYDALGLAVSQHDELIAIVTDDAGVRVDVEGQGAATLPSDETHLVARAAAQGFSAVGIPLPGLLIRCRNTIPQGRGLGSSAAAIVAGLLIARGLIDDGDVSLDDEAVLSIATAMEGHPDNVAAALFGGFTTAWADTTEGEVSAHAISRQVHPAVTPIVAIPPTAVSTRAARELLGDTVSREAAVFNIARVAALSHALCSDPQLLFLATEDRLHQQDRASTYPESHRIMAGLRERGHASMISGAGPAVLTLVGAQNVTDVQQSRVTDEVVTQMRHICGPDWLVLALTVDHQGAQMHRRRLSAGG